MSEAHFKTPPLSNTESTTVGQLYRCFTLRECGSNLNLTQIAGSKAA